VVTWGGGGGVDMRGKRPDTGAMPPGARGAPHSDRTPSVAVGWWLPPNADRTPASGPLLHPQRPGGLLAFPCQVAARVTRPGLPGPPPP